jgi:hypothetical protein
VRKALTPLLTGSTPVMAVQPAAKARRISHHPTACVAGAIGGGGFTGAGWPAIALHSPNTSRPIQEIANR